MENLALARERSAQDEESVRDQGVHESRVLVPSVLLAKIARPIPWTATLEPDREEHDRDVTPGLAAACAVIQPCSLADRGHLGGAGRKLVGRRA